MMFAPFCVDDFDFASLALSLLYLSSLEQKTSPLGCCALVSIRIPFLVHRQVKENTMPKGNQPPFFNQRSELEPDG